MSPKEMLSHLANHLEHKQDHIRIDQDQYNAAITECCITPTLPLQPSTLVPHIAGLAIHEGFRCSDCNWIATNKHSFSMHYRQQHSTIKLPKVFQPCYVQSYNNTVAGKAWFQVTFVQPTVHQQINQIEEALKIVEDEVTVPLQGLTASEDPRTVSPWLHLTKWYFEVQNLDASLLHQTTNAGKEFNGLNKAVNKWMRSASIRQDMLDKISRQKLHTDDPMKELVFSFVLCYTTNC